MQITQPARVRLKTLKYFNNNRTKTLNNIITFSSCQLSNFLFCFFLEEATLQSSCNALNCSDICAYGKYLPQCQLIFGFWTNKIAHLSCMSHYQKKPLRKSMKYMPVSALIARTFRCLWCRGRTNQNITVFNNFFNLYLTQAMMEWLWSASVRLVRLFLTTTGLVHVSCIIYNNIFSYIIIVVIIIIIMVITRYFLIETVYKGVMTFLIITIWHVVQSLLNIYCCCKFCTYILVIQNHNAPITNVITPL